MALHAAARGITVNAICPGWVETEMSAARFEELGITREQAGAGIPIGRMSTPQEIANLVVFLAGAGAASITGQALVVDGGSSVAA
jgi:acetoacetyl-CoA reductase